jgi:hypothetical protein
MPNKDATVIVRLDPAMQQTMDCLTENASANNGWKRVTKSDIVRTALAIYFGEVLTGKLGTPASYRECHGCEKIFLATDLIEMANDPKRNFVMYLCRECFDQWEI